MKNRVLMGVAGCSGRQRAATLVDIMIIVLIVALGGSLFFAYVARGSEINNRVRCAQNLRQIGTAMLMYSNENRGNFPRTVYEKGAPVTEFTGAQAPNPFGPGGPSANDATAGAFLLIRTQELGQDHFVCPSTRLMPWDFGGKASQQVSNFPGSQHLGYSFSNPYPGEKATAMGYRHNTLLTSGFPVAADMNPGGAALAQLSVKSPPDELRLGNSKNHGTGGQNVLFGDMRVVFSMTSFCGVQGDCMYTAGADNGGAGANSPATATDSILLPIATIDPGYAGVTSVLLWLGIGVLIAIAIIVLFILKLRTKKGARP